MSEQKKIHSSEKQSTLSVQPSPPVVTAQQPPTSIHAYQRIYSSLHGASPEDVRVLQRTVGNQSVQKLFGATVQCRTGKPEQEAAQPVQSERNTTGLPNDLKTGIELLSALSLDDVHVHYHSSRPTQVQALAYTQGTDIYVGPGQEQHLAHEAWHVVQQKQGRVNPTIRLEDTLINDDTTLEQEAETMGALAESQNNQEMAGLASVSFIEGNASSMQALQMVNGKKRSKRKFQKRYIKQGRKQRSMEKRKRLFSNEDIDDDAFFTNYVPETPRPEMLEVGAGEGDFSAPLRKELSASGLLEKEGGKSHYLTTDVANEAGETGFLETAQAQEGVDVQYGVDANLLHKQFRSSATDVVIGINPYGLRGVPYASYGLLRESGKTVGTSSGESTLARIPDMRFLEAARHILKPGGVVIIRGRSNTLRKYFASLNANDPNLTELPKLKKTNPYMDIEPNVLFMLAQVGFHIEVRSVRPPAITRQGTTGAPDTPERGGAILGDYNTEFRFIKTDENPTVTFIAGTTRHQIQISGNAQRGRKAEITERRQKTSKAKAKRELRRQILEDVIEQENTPYDDEKNFQDDDEVLQPKFKPAFLSSQHTVQRFEDDKDRQELAELEELAKTSGPDEALRGRATALYRKKPTPEERARIMKLVEIFNRPKQDQPKTEKKSWDDKTLAVVKKMGEVSAKLYSLAMAVQPYQRAMPMLFDPREFSDPAIVAAYNKIVIKDYLPGNQSLREWVALYHALKGVQAHSNELHVIHFFTSGHMAPISVMMSTHTYGEDPHYRPDYLVHDIRSLPWLQLEKREVMMSRDVPEAYRVNYAGFTQKIEDIKRKDNVTDADIAKVMLAIIKTPGTPPPYVVPRESLQVFTELVATWMLAETVRHRSTMLSSILELKLIKDGQRTFAESLGADATGGTHPMSHGKSLAQGIAAEMHEKEIFEGGTPVNVPGKPTTKQVAQIMQIEKEENVREFNRRVKELFESLFNLYLPEVNRVILLEELEK